MRSATKKRTGKDKNYLAWIHTLPCVVCAQAQRSPTEAAHVGERGLSQKCPDRETLPLCGEHHRTGKESHHVLQKAFWAHHKLDRDFLIAFLQVKYEAERAAA
jgi:hypothetical protein